MLTATQLEKLKDDGRDDTVVEVHAVLRSKSDGLIVHYTRVWFESTRKRENLEERVAFFDASGSFRSGIFVQ